MRDDGHGKTHGRFTIPTMAAEMLRKHLNALIAPKHQAATGGTTTFGAPGAERMGAAFVEYIERYPLDRTPYAGGVAATVVITMDLNTFTTGDNTASVSAAMLDTGVPVSPGQARRMACEAGIVPMVLNGASQPLDVGRKQRLHNEPQRLAIMLRDGGCSTEGCDVPPAMCHVHHEDPWSHGGSTSVDRGRALCPKHHHMIHNPTYQAHRHPHGKISFHRRQ